MIRFDQDMDGSMEPREDGEWVRYSDHIDAMKRIAGDGRTDAELTEAAKESINVAIELMVVHYGKGWSTHVNVLRNLLDGPSFARATPQQAMPEGWKLVPVEPTESMRLAPAKDRPGFSRNVAAEIYRSMLAAAPQAVPALTDAERDSARYLNLIAQPGFLHYPELKAINAFLQRLLATPQPSQEPEKALTDVDIVNIAREHLHTVDGHNIMFHLRHAGHDAIIAFTRAILAASQPFPKLFGFDVMVDDILPEGTMELRYQKYQD